MIPPTPSQDVKSAAEKKIFQMFKTDPECKDYTVLHSLGLSNHIKRQYGEIDFVVLAPNEGIFCLEVKGGRVKCEGGIWTFIDRYGNTNTKNYSPFNQAREGMFSLLEAIRKNFGSNHRLHKLVFRYGVMFPSIEFTESSPEYERWEIFDLRDKGPIARYIKRLSQHTHKKVKSTLWYNDKESRPTLKDIEDLIKFLRSDFEIIPPPTVVLTETEKNIFKLTDEQYNCLDALENNDRCLFNGGGGTGKTMIAAEYARREVEKGRNVGFFCYNKLLALQIEKNLTSTIKNKDFLTVSNLHRFIRNKINKSDFEEEFLNEQKNSSNNSLFYKEKYPFYGILGIQSDLTFKPFDTLIIDEAQDLITSDNLDFFNEILLGGLNGGKWAIFADFFRQAIYSDLNEKQMRKCLTEYAPYFTDYKLKINCRNTKKIGEETSAVSGFSAPPFLPSEIEGVPVDYIFYENENEKIEKIESILQKLSEDKIAPKMITVLSAVAVENSCFELLSKSKSFDIDQLSHNFFEEGFNKITFSTIHSFKGLENSIIVMTDVNDLTSSTARSLMYVGMSRARQKLFMVISKDLKDKYDDISRERLTKILSK